ncbi:MAG: CDP-alcohol phosphatidyltransferase family protein, partial [Firmicutes bacterium]|nr:CDP-alcohol phosphatidyltransferase family protein [Bacillota bacterium]
MNLPNQLTIMRICLIPIMVAVYALDPQGSILGIPILYWELNLIFIIGAITDNLDGRIARKRNQITTFGKFADPLADKILV